MDESHGKCFLLQTNGKQMINGEALRLLLNWDSKNAFGNDNEILISNAILKVGDCSKMKHHIYITDNSIW